MIRIAVLRSIAARVLCFSPRNCGRGMCPICFGSCLWREHNLYLLKLYTHSMDDYYHLRWDEDACVILSFVVAVYGLRPYATAREGNFLFPQARGPVEFELPLVDGMLHYIHSGLNAVGVQARKSMS